MSCDRKGDWMSRKRKKKELKKKRKTIYQSQDNLDCVSPKVSDIFRSWVKFIPVKLMLPSFKFPTKKSSFLRKERGRRKLLVSLSYRHSTYLPAFFLRRFILYFFIWTVLELEIMKNWKCERLFFADLTGGAILKVVQTIIIALKTNQSQYKNEPSAKPSRSIKISW